MNARVASSIALVAVLLAGCGSGQDAANDSVAPVAADRATTATSTVDTLTIATTGPEIGTGAIEPDLGAKRSIADALLPDDAFPRPWDPKHRDPAVVGYGSSPFQSSCPEYEIAEQFAGRSGGQVFWWIDGGNANQYVSREAYPGEGVVVVEMVGDAADTCGTVTWGEGGGVVLEPLDLGDGVTGFSMATEGSDERGLVAATSHADLISVLWVPLWPGLESGDYPDLTETAFAEIAQQTRSLLLAAGPATAAELAPPTTLARPSNTADPNTPTTLARPSNTADPDAPTTIAGTVPGEAPASRPATIPPPVATAPLDPAIAALLLAPGDLDETWRHESTEPFDAAVMGSDLPDLGGCGYEEAIRRMEPIVQAFTEWRQTALSTGTQGPTTFFSQAVGVAPSAEEADHIVERFADADCDFNALLGGTPDAESDAGVTSSGGMVDVTGIAVPVAELNLTVEWYHHEALNRNQASMIMFANGSVISLVTVNALLDEPPTEVAHEIAAIAFDKITTSGAS